ncbi:ubiE/COQ5 methyltransferase family-domain-containing protein [Gigaspora rosea]|uniref:UbiE/COQ5 methyltransferase family-domain-containing protein n=1 Tax=Gigaspora rosea TaxID=44941 RepID=A0A397UM06_9GLOM|nr:ubiE/COQ5 methyltransferase family-domain-containing protein [Gigaspora rosea]
MQKSCVKSRCIGLLRPLILSKSRLTYPEIFRGFASSTSQRTSDQQAIKDDDKKEPEINFGFKYVPESMKEKLAFGIRNCTHIDRVLSEAYRVLRPGGRFMCLEFGKVPNPIVSSIYNLYSFQIIPVLGQVIAADRDSYQYLVESIQRFPSQDKFTEMIKDTGFTVIDKGWEDLTFGIAAIHSGFKL